MRCSYSWNFLTTKLLSTLIELEVSSARGERENGTPCGGLGPVHVHWLACCWVSVVSNARWRNKSFSAKLSPCTRIMVLPNRRVNDEPAPACMTMSPPGLVGGVVLYGWIKYFCCWHPSRRLVVGSGGVAVTTRLFKTNLVVRPSRY